MVGVLQDGSVFRGGLGVVIGIGMMVRTGDSVSRIQLLLQGGDSELVQACIGVVLHQEQRRELVAVLEDVSRGAETLGRIVYRPGVPVVGDVACGVDLHVGLDRVGEIIRLGQLVGGVPGGEVYPGLGPVEELLDGQLAYASPAVRYVPPDGLAVVDLEGVVDVLLHRGIVLVIVEDGPAGCWQVGELRFVDRSESGGVQGGEHECVPRFPVHSVDIRGLVGVEETLLPSGDGHRVGGEPHQVLLGEVQSRLGEGGLKHAQDRGLGGGGPGERPAGAPRVLIYSLLPETGTVTGLLYGTTTAHSNDLVLIHIVEIVILLL